MSGGWLSMPHRMCGMTRKSGTWRGMHFLGRGPMSTHAKPDEGIPKKSEPQVVNLGVRSMATLLLMFLLLQWHFMRVEDRLSDIEQRLRAVGTTAREDEALERARGRAREAQAEERAVAEFEAARARAAERGRLDEERRKVEEARKAAERLKDEENAKWLEEYQAEQARKAEESGKSGRDQEPGAAGTPEKAAPEGSR